MSDLFHITETRLVKSIRRKGLLPGRPSRFDGGIVEPHKAYVYLSDDYRWASWRAGLGSDDLDLGDYSILVIDGECSFIDADLFRPDEDYLRDKLKLTPAQAREAVEANANLWADSLSKWHSVAYKGSIDPEAIYDVVRYRLAR